MPNRNLTIIFVAAVISTLCYKEAQRSRYAYKLSEVIDTISSFYVKDVDKRALFEDGIAGMIENLDPYSGYISPDDLTQFNIDMSQQFGGVGIEVGIRENRLTVISPLPGTPAYEAGVLAGDVIHAVDGKSAENTKLSDLVKLIQGTPGTEVRLKIQHAGESEFIEVPILRAIIEVESIRGDRRNADGDWIFTLKSHPRIGYIRLSKFAQKTTSELQESIGEIQQDIDGLILDLRGNPGGLLNAAVDICELFTEKGQEIVSIKRRREILQQQFVSKNSPFVKPNLPLAVLVNSYSASASEIVAACLQDHKRAEIIGQRTWGKGTVQNVIKIEAGRSALRLTTATYWRPNGRNIHRHVDDDESAEWGVKPQSEFTVELSDEEYQKIMRQRYDQDIVSPGGEIEPKAIEDPQLNRAIEYIEKASSSGSLPALAA